MASIPRPNVQRDDEREAPAAGARPDPRAWIEEALVRHQDTVRGFVRMQMNAELRALESESDLAQSAIREVLAHPERVAWRGEAEFRNWLYGAVLNKVRDKIRLHRAARRDARRAVPLDTARRSTLLQSYHDVLGEVARVDELDKLERAFDRLGERQRAVMARFFYLGQRHGEIALELGMTEDNSKQVLRRAKADLAVALARSD